MRRLILLLPLLFAAAAAAVAQWEWQSPRPQGNVLLGISFIDSSRGWSVGEYGTVIHTSDGGLTWEEQEYQRTDDVLDVAMVSDTEGWAVGDNGVILHTIDGGGDWLEQSSGVTGGLNAVCFTDPLNGWAGGDNEMILHTSDGGASWGIQHQSNAPPVSVNAIQFLNDSVGWAVGSSRTLLSTTNGGATWTKQVVGTVSAAYLTVCFVNASLGFIAGTGGVLLRTDDGGTTWPAVASGVTTNLNRIVMQNSVVGWIAGDAGAFLRTVNGGLSWSMTTLAGGNNLNGLARVGGKIWAAGELGSILSSTNSGVSWTTLDAGPRLSANWIDCPGGSTAVAVGQTGLILRTTDAGASWNTQASPVPSVSCYGVKFTDALHGWAVGDNGTIIRTVDGATWTQQTSPVSASLLGVTFNTNGWIVGADFNTFAGVVLRSTDGGNSWGVQNAALPHVAYGVAFTSSASGWITGEQGMILHTTDGGTTWPAQASGVTNALFWCAFADGSNGWAVGEAGTILHTGDGGGLWSPQSSGVADNLYSIAVRSPLEAIVSGDNGDVLHTTDGGATWNLEYSRTLHSLFGAAANGTGDIWMSGDYGTILHESIAPPLTGLIVGTLFDDLNGNGAQDAGEPGLAARRVRIGGDAVDSLLTAPSGGFTFSGLSNGTYTLSAGPVALYTQTVPVSPDSYTIVLDPLHPNGSGNFGFHSPQVVSYPVDFRWNLVSLPEIVPDPSKLLLYPLANSAAFRYTGVYQIADSIRHGTGYWLKFPRADTARIAGTPVAADTIPLDAGWNLVGSVGDTLPVSAVVTDPPGIIASNFFEYRGGYAVPAVIRPGRGYWVKAGQPGSLILGPAGPAAPPSQELPRAGAGNELRISDRAGNSALLRFGGTDVAASDLPPVPPAEAFDARFSTGRDGAIVSSPGPPAMIRVLNPVMPLTLSWSVRDGARYALSDGAGRVVASMIGGGTAELDGPAPGALALAAGDAAAGRPAAFELRQNEPNPFNPSTVVRFALPERSRVTITVYTLLGQRVAVLADGEMDAGDHAVSWAPSTASGVYICRMEASSASGERYTAVRKMLLMK